MKTNKHKIPFDKELAKALTTNENTIRSWEYRGYIPISALKGKTPTISNDFTERIKTLYNSTSFKKSAFNTKLEYSAKFYDFCRGKLELTDPELTIVTTTLKSYEVILDDALTLLRTSQTSKALKLVFTICKPYAFLQIFEKKASILDKVRRDRPFYETEQARFMNEIKLLKFKLLKIYE